MQKKGSHSIWWKTVSAVALHSDAGGDAAADVIRNIWLGGADRGCLPHSLLLVPADVSASVGAGSAILATCSGIQVSVTHNRCLDRCVYPCGCWLNDGLPALGLSWALQVLRPIIAASIIFVTTNTCLSWQHTFFVATKVCLPQQNFCFNKVIFVATKYFCHNKRFVTTNIFVTTSILLSQQKMCFVATNLCYFCCDKTMFVATNICHNRTFVATNTCCRNKNDTCGSSCQWY